ncbi:hypothetical protein AB0M54_20440 [Actinoplanes sp. NPDC051470]|uniref:hypothetical protein n=1 Tax=Actinoplanes sp. NPDC051470 TaxID=3157224 RepID=UPI003413AE1E
MRDWRRPTAIIAGVVLAGVLAGVAVVAVTGPDEAATPAVAPARSPEVAPADPSAQPIPDRPAAERPAVPSPRRSRSPERLRDHNKPPALPDGPGPPADRPVVVERPEDMAPEPRPDGVPEQVNFFFGGGPECFDRIPPPPPAITLSDDAVIPSRFQLCFMGFDKERPVRITLTPPGGRTITRTLPATRSEEQGHRYEWPRLPSHRAGAHRITARQGNTVVTKTVNVLRPARPRLWIDRPPAFRASTDVHMYYAGFPPDSMVAFNLYAGEGYRATFRVPADASGGGHAILRTGDDPPDGCFGVSHPALGDSTGDEPPNTENGFCTSGAE